MWWNKSLILNEHITISDEGIQDVVAFMFMSSEISGYVDPKHRESETIVKTPFASLNLYSLTPELDQLCLKKLNSDPSKDNLGSLGQRGTRNSLSTAAAPHITSKPSLQDVSHSKSRSET
jgi:hypothetical protein